MKLVNLTVCCLIMFGVGAMQTKICAFAEPAVGSAIAPVEQSSDHGGKIESKYDGFTHETTITLKKMKITCGSMKGNFKDSCVSLEAALHCPGIQLDYVREVSLQLIFQTKDWDQRHPPEHRDLSIVADGKTYRIGRMRLVSQSTDTLMTETLEASMPYQLFLSLARAEVVEMKVGPSQFELRPQNVIAFKDMVNRVKV